MGIAIAAATALVVVTAGSILLPRSQPTEPPPPVAAAPAPVAQPTPPAPPSPAAPVAAAPTPPTPAATTPNPPSSSGSAPAQGTSTAAAPTAQRQPTAPAAAQPPSPQPKATTIAAPVGAQQAAKTDNKADDAAAAEPSRVVAATEPGASASGSAPIPAPSEAKPSSPTANDGPSDDTESGKDPVERAAAKKHEKDRDKDKDKDRDKDKDKTADKTATGKRSAREVSDASGDKRSKSSRENAVLPPSDGSVPEPPHQSSADCVLPEKDMAREAWRRNWPTVCSVGDKAFVLIPLKGVTQGEVHELRHHPNREARVTLPATSESQLSMRQYKINRLGFKDLRINPMDEGGTRFRLKLDPEGGDPVFEVKDGYAKITIAPPPGQN